MTEPTEPEMLLLSEAARELGISRTHAYDLHQRGEFPVPVLKLGRCFRVSQTVLEEYKRTGQPIASVSSGTGDPAEELNRLRLVDRRLKRLIEGMKELLAEAEEPQAQEPGQGCAKGPA